MRISRLPLALLCLFFTVDFAYGQEQCNDLIIVPITQAFCSDFSPPYQIGVSVPSGNAEIEYDWNNNISDNPTSGPLGVSNGRYTVTVTDGKLQRGEGIFEVQDDFVAGIVFRDQYCDGNTPGNVQVRLSRCYSMAIQIRRSNPSGPDLLPFQTFTGTSDVTLNLDATPGLYTISFSNFNPNLGSSPGASFNFTINDIASPTPSVSNVSAADCGMSNGSVTIDPFGGNNDGNNSLGSSGENGGLTKSLAQSYAWSDGFTTSNPTRNGLAAGSYGVSVSDDAFNSEHCDCHPSITIDVPGTDSYIDDPGCILLENGTCPANNATTSRTYCADDLTNGGVPLDGSPATCTDGATPSYQWFNSIMGSAPLAINGATREDYIIPHTPATRSTNRRYWRKAFCDCETVDDVDFSNEVQVNYSSVTVGIEPFDDDICAGESVTLTAFEDQVGTGADTYRWSTGQTGQTITVTPFSSRTYTVTITDGLGCSDSESAFINVSGVAGFNISHLREGSYYCEGETVDFYIPQARSLAAVTYTWDFDVSGNSASPATGTGLNPSEVSYNIPASGVLNATVSCTASENGCVTTETTNVTFYADPIITNVTTTNGDCNNPDGSLTVFWQGQSGQTAPLQFFLEGFDSDYVFGGSGAASQNKAYSNVPPGTYTLFARYSQAPRCAIEVGTYEIIGSSPINITFPGGNAITCADGNDGGVFAQATGGAGGFSYLWNTGSNQQSISNLSEGTYTITATDALGCTAEQSITFNDPPAITIDVITQTDATCFGGSDGVIRVDAEQGRAPYSYRWAHGPNGALITGLSAGNYTVTVTDANGCTASTTYSIGQTPEITIGFPAGNGISCFGEADGAVVAQASGGNGNFSYAWSNGATTPNNTDLSAGTYTVTATDGQGCTEVGSFTFSNPPQVTVGVLTQTDVSCPGGNDGSIRVRGANGVTPYSFQWGHGPTTPLITNLTAGTYTVTVTDNNGCTGSRSITIDEGSSGPSVGVTVTNVSCFGESDGTATATVNGGTPPFSYSWSNTTQTTSTITNLPSGPYTVTVTDANGCTGSRSNFVGQPSQALVYVGGSVNDPSCSNVNDGSISILVDGGTPGYSYLWSNGQTVNPITGLSGGTYAVTVTDTEGCELVRDYILIQPSSISIDFVENNSVSCFGGADGSISVSASGGTGRLTYSWSNGVSGPTVTGLGAGNYIVTVTDANGCSTGIGIIMDEPEQALFFSNESLNAPSCSNINDGSITVIAA